jgi:hypothetical protein
VKTDLTEFGIRVLEYILYRQEVMILALCQFNGHRVCHPKVCRKGDLLKNRIINAVEILNEARDLISPSNKHYRTDDALTPISPELGLAILYISEQLAKGRPVHRRPVDVFLLNRAVTALKHFAIDRGEACDYLNASLLAGTAAGTAMCWFDPE